MTVSTGITQAGASGSVIISLASVLSWLAPFPLVSAITGPLRALTCSMLFRFFEKTASLGAIKIEGKSGRINAMMPCLRSEERRVGKECRYQWSRSHEQQKKKQAN